MYKGRREIESETQAYMDTSVLARARVFWASCHTSSRLETEFESLDQATKCAVYLGRRTLS